MKNGKYFVYVSILITFLVIAVFGVTYSWYNTEDNDSSNLVVKYEVSSLVNVKSVDLDNNKVYINAFDVKSNDGKDVSYKISLYVDAISEEFKSKNIKYELIDANNKSLTGVRNFENVEEFSTINLYNNAKSEGSVYFEFRIWNDGDALDKNSSLSSHLMIEEVEF